MCAVAKEVHNWYWLMAFNKTLALALHFSSPARYSSYLRQLGQGDESTAFLLDHVDVPLSLGRALCKRRCVRYLLTPRRVYDTISSPSP
jgi:hypothetical protein